MCNFWNFVQMPSFMPKYSNFENQPVTRKSLPIERKYTQFRPNGVEREYMWNFWHFGQWPVSCPNMEILKFILYLGKRDVRRAKISSISIPWGRKKVYVQLLELWPMAKFHAQIWQF